MCGITGCIDFQNAVSGELLGKMVLALSHRGPDDQGIELFNLPNCSVGLGHVRLSIIDISTAGHQPMQYDEVVITYNGEIYNYIEIKDELRQLGHRFKSKTDTEVVLHAYSEWGIDCVTRFIGMFSFVLLDKASKMCYFVRDRAGVKPLFFYRRNDLVLFTSELKTLHVHPRFSRELDELSIQRYFNFGFIPAPHSIFKYCSKIEPGYYTQLDLGTNSIKSVKYWEAQQYYRHVNNEIHYSEAKETLRGLISSACEYRMISDVPVGVFLSGGYDSTAVTALLQSGRTEKIKTFTIGFDEGNNEAPSARKIADYLGTDHHEHYCTTREAQDIVEDLPYYYDEPFADSSAIPTILVSKMARASVKVALSADAGDEVFAGYNNYAKILAHASNLERIPASIIPLTKRALQMALSYVPLSKEGIRHKIESIASTIQENRKKQLLDLFWKSNSLPIDYSSRLLINNASRLEGYDMDVNAFGDRLSVLLATDYKYYLADDILAKVDRATMSVSLEGREPLLDHRILEFVATLPSTYKHNGTQGKLILKDIVHGLVPKELMARPKVGFSIPIYNWLQKDLAYMVDDYLLDPSVNTGILNKSFVEELVEKFRSNKLYYKTIIWKVLVFNMWYQKWMN